MDIAALLLVVPLGAVVIVVASARHRPQWSGRLALGAAALTVGLVAVAWQRGAASVTVPWIPEWNAALTLTVDGLALSYALLTAAVAVLVLVYSIEYVPHHLNEQGRPARELGSFFALFTLFIAAMVGLVLSLNLLQFFLFWDATAICSYLLIAYDRQSPDARRAALMALLVTGIPSMLLLGAAVMLQSAYGTMDLAAIKEAVRGDGITAAAAGMLVVAAMAKSAQWPLHFWLPRAMAAPTPVSAYLHAAAMVAAGVFLLQRLQPFLEIHRPVAHVVVAAGWLSMAGGGLLALRERHLKRILAYSTVAQYGHVVFLIGLGGPAGAAAATFFVLAHGLCKSALFLAAGAVTRATGADDLRQLGGLRRAQPLLAVATAVVAAGLAGMPLTIGFFKDELLFERAWHAGPLPLAAAMCGPALTLAYIWRFWSGIFLGPREPPGARLSPLLVWPIACAALLTAGLGLVPLPVSRLAERAAEASLAPVTVDAAYHLALRPSTAAALGAIATGVLVLVVRPRIARLLDVLAAAAGPEALYSGLLRALRRSGHFIGAAGPRILRARLAVVFLSAAALVVAGQLAVGVTFQLVQLPGDELPLGVALGVVSLAAVATVAQRQQLRMTLALSVTSIALAAVFALAGAPDVALVLVVINVVSTLLIVALLQRLPADALAEPRQAPSLWRWPGEDYALAGVGGLLGFLVAWSTLSQPLPAASLGEALLSASTLAHAGNVVAAALIDFRGLDTMGEITVVAISVMAVDLLMRTGEDR